MTRGRRVGNFHPVGTGEINLAVRKEEVGRDESRAPV